MNRCTFWMLSLLLFLVVLTITRENVINVVSFRIVPQNRLRHRSQYSFQYNTHIIYPQSVSVSVCSKPTCTISSLRSSVIMSVASQSIETTAIDNNIENRNHNMNKKNKRRTQKRRKKRTRSSNEKDKNIYNKNKKDYNFRPDDIEIWRIYGISVHPDSLEKDNQGSPVPSSTNAPFNETMKTTSTSTYRSIVQYKNTDDHIMELPSSLQRALIRKLRLVSIPSGTRCVRQSLDARKKLDHPVYNYVVDIPIQASLRHSLGWKVKSGRIELLEIISCDDTSSSIIEEEKNLDSGKMKKNMSRRKDMIRTKRKVNNRKRPLLWWGWALLVFFVHCDSP